MYFILFDPIFLIGKTLATFDRMVTKLQRQIEKVDAELEANKDATFSIGFLADEKVQKVEEKASIKLAKVQAKAMKKEAKVADKAKKMVTQVRARTSALNDAKRRAANAAKNISKLMED